MLVIQSITWRLKINHQFWKNACNFGLDIEPHIFMVNKHLDILDQFIGRADVLWTNFVAPYLFPHMSWVMQTALCLSPMDWSHAKVTAWCSKVFGSCNMIQVWQIKPARLAFGCTGIWSKLLAYLFMPYALSTCQWTCVLCVIGSSVTGAADPVSTDNTEAVADPRHKTGALCPWVSFNIIDGSQGCSNRGYIYLYTLPKSG